MATIHNTNPLLPEIYQIKSVTQETRDTFTLVLSQHKKSAPSFAPGQFNMLYLFGFGEIPISISGDPSRKQELVHTIRAVGAITQAMQKLKVGDELGVRGPFGTSWPLTKTGCDALIIAGGLGLAPLRPALLHLLAHRSQFKNITLLYGARLPEDVLYKDELQYWKEQGIEIQISVDQADANLRGHIGVVTTLIRKYFTSLENTLIFLCGPEIMMKFSLTELIRCNANEEFIYLSMERNMKCAIGFCGHCQYGPYLLCRDGPIFSYQQLKPWLPIKEL